MSKKHFIIAADFIIAEVEIGNFNKAEAMHEALSKFFKTTLHTFDQSKFNNYIEKKLGNSPKYFVHFKESYS